MAGAEEGVGGASPVALSLVALAMALNGAEGCKR